MVHTVDHLPPQPHNLSTNQKVCSTIPSSSILHVKTSWSPSFVLRTHPSVSVYVSVLDTKNEYVRGHVTMMCSAKCCVRSSVTSFCSTVKFQEDWTIKWAGMILHWNRSNINSAIILFEISLHHISTTSPWNYLWRQVTEKTKIKMWWWKEWFQWGEEG